MESTGAITTILIAILIGLVFVQSESTAGKQPENKPTNVTEPISVIILTYSRSGSSFVGELLSSHPSASYIFEPLYYPAMTLRNTTTEAYNDVLTKLLTCDTSMLDQVRADAIMGMIRKFGTIEGKFLKPKYSSQKVTDLCKASINRVVKTIRLKLSDALKIIADGKVPNLKILHLMRDPRARYNSMMDTSGFWNPKERKLEAICSTMEQDLRLAESVPPSQYRLVKYEDLVTNTEVVIKDLFANLYGIQTLPQETLSYIQDHAKKGNLTVPNYYSTVRDSKFVPDHWEHDLNQTTIEMVQNNPSCKYLIDKLHYPMKQFK